MKTFTIGLVMGCVIALMLIGLGTAIRDSIRSGLAFDCVRNGRVVLSETVYECSFKKESR